MAGALAALALCAGCSFGITAGSAAPPSAGVARTPAGGSAISIPVSASASGAGQPTPSASAPATSCAQRVYASMTEAQRVGQLFLVGIKPDVVTPYVTAAIARYHFGSVLYAPSATGVAAIGQVSASIQALASTAATGGARFFIAANQEGGEIQHLTGPGFATIPSELVQGSSSTAAERASARLWGTQLKAAGVDLDLAPVMDVVPQATTGTNAPIGELDREFGYDPVTNGTHGAAFIQGMAQAGVATSAKHFPGLGKVRGNTDFSSDVTDTVTTRHDPDLASFQSAVDAGAPFVMIATATYTQIDPGHLAAFSPVVIQQMLRQDMGFSGVVISDDLGQAAQVASIPAGTRAIDFLDAGGDMITSQVIGPAETMASDVLARADSSASFRAVVKSAVIKVLTAKQAYGLLPC